ncbi:GNAT family N-acetyltransferase [Rossellomorea sp. NPDC077527]|uniref:GNAT family N-acetyltransferase n=1 Tax=Rossellomorea sp. NPDC077527 TaxID=3364510 RepID=UPI0037C7C6D8
MYFTFKPINMVYLKEIDAWNYEGFIEEVLMTPYFDSFNKTGRLIGPGGCEGFAAILENDTVGLFEFNSDGSTLEIGLALKPSLVGKGLGAKFVREGIEFGIQHYNGKHDEVKLVVDAQNKAAIRVYEKVGFTTINQSEDEIEMSLVLKER